MSEAISWVGIDAGKAVLAMAASRAKGWVEFSIPNDPAAVRRTVKRLQRESGGRVIFCYEAGAVGYVLQRQIQTLGSECVVVAPSLIPVKPGIGSRRTGGTRASWAKCCGRVC